MSYGQLFPNGTVPSSSIQTADFAGFNSAKFSSLQPQGTCKGATRKDLVGTALYPERVQDGWYQLPGDTEYYGGDKTGSAVVGSVTGVGAAFDIDSACGPTGKAVYDAAAIADPEIDYSDYDTDKDGVVDFFMMVFVGLGGNGDSQLNGMPPYDNVWPHSSSLEFYYTDANGQKGYVSDDQLKDLEGRPLYYTDANRATMTTAMTAFKVFVRVGPYNVNPEAAIDSASVISHEYGHSLGLPDFYSLGNRETYGTWNLMASDHSQHMDVFGKQELGWLVPQTLTQTTTITNMVDSKVNTHQIVWKTAAGVPYTLTGALVNNGQGYTVKLPPRQLIDPAKIVSGASPTHVWWSQSGNDFGCPPSGGHNLDIALPGLRNVPSGTTASVSFRSLWDTEWDFDYGFVMVSTDGGKTYQSLASKNGYTTPGTTNPNSNGCQQQYGNGITGSSGSYAAGTQQVDRLAGNYPASTFLTDTYDLPAEAIGKDNVVLRFSYVTDPGLARPGWFIDNLKVTAGAATLFSSDFEASGGPDDPAVFNGGCKDLLRVAETCTRGWQYIDSEAGSPADHAYYLEMRSRAGFDYDGKGQSDRGAPTFLPGLSLVYTDEAHGYGNVGTDDPPAQHPLDSQPQPSNEAPNLDDAAWTADAGDSHFSDSGAGHVDNYTDPRRADSLWRFDFDCLTFDVLSMTGNTVSAATQIGDLRGAVRFTVGPGCGAGLNGDPTAIAQARPTTALVGQEVVFDGSGSFDDRDAASALQYKLGL